MQGSQSKTDKTVHHIDKEEIKKIDHRWTLYMYIQCHRLHHKVTFSSRNKWNTSHDGIRYMGNC